MAKKESDRSCLRSRFGGGWVTKQQALAEEMCDRLARRDGGGLADQFWQRPPWDRRFRLQTTLANRLLKAFSYEAVTGALRSVEGKRYYSLGSKPLRVLVEREEQRLALMRELRQERMQDFPPEATPEPPRPAPKAKSVLDVLKGMD